MPSEGPGTKASYLRRRRPDAQTPQLPPGPLLPTCCCHTPPPGSQIRRSASPYPQGGHSTPHLLRSSLSHHHGELARRRSTTGIGLRDGKSGHQTSRSDCRPKANLLWPPTAPTWATGSGQLHAAPRPTNRGSSDAGVAHSPRSTRATGSGSKRGGQAKQGTRGARSRGHGPAAAILASARTPGGLLWRRRGWRKEEAAGVVVVAESPPVSPGVAAFSL
uniref:Uncharacterized protein n=1 Tax=Zea mays TaxID=4577 RepID=B6U633_MAIZE|nr:hypothetical protein [Zea mays]|eukprot:NP_001145075.1 uncharacterized protein LOC100278275 [Zea mays]